jgi:hypothetical protein
MNTMKNFLVLYFIYERSDHCLFPEFREQAIFLCLVVLTL